MPTAYQIVRDHLPQKVNVPPPVVVFPPAYQGPLSMLNEEQDSGLSITRTLCVFAYFEKDDTYRTNLQFFLTHGIHDGMDYVIVINGAMTRTMIPDRSNVRILWRRNTGYDFGAYQYALDHTEIEQYSHFLFVNSSVRGPFQKGSLAWEHHFLDLLRGNIRLVGTTINTLFDYDGKNGNHIHVQSMVFCMDRNTLVFLRPEIFSDKHLNTGRMWDVIVNKEIKMSQMILKRGWNLSCTARKFQGYDYRFLQKNINPPHSDPCYPGAYFGGDLDAYEIIFIKTNRGLVVPDQHEQAMHSEPPPIAKLIEETGGLDRI